MRRLPRTIQLDRSDNVVFAQAADPGEWAVPGTFLFAGRAPDTLGRKDQIAFRSGFLGIDSFGWSTLVVVSDARDEEREAAIDALADRFVTTLGAPDRATARPAAMEEIDLAEDLCRGHAVGTLIALHRAAGEGGEIVERFRTLTPRSDTAFGASYLGGHDRAFHVVETDEDEDDTVDIVSLGSGDGRA